MLKRILLPLAAMAALSANGLALVITGTDPDTGPGDPRPNSDAAAAAFDTLAGDINPIGVITFENSALGTFNTITPKPGVKVTNLSGIDTAIDATPTPDLGYNTTPFGRKYLRFWQSGNNLVEQVDFEFDMAISAFGAYFTGAQENFPGIFTVAWVDQNGNNGSFVLDKPAPNPNDGTAATEFAGFVDPNLAVTKVSIIMTRADLNGGRDLIGIDDVRYTACAVPEPGTMAALGLGVAALVRRRRKA